MSDLKATPGAWFISGSMTKYIEARIDGGWIQEVAACGPTDADNGYGEQQRANANLIAVAPKMYKFLEDIAHGRGVDYPIEKLLMEARGES